MHRTWASVPVGISKGPFVSSRFEKTPARAHLMPKYLGTVVRRIRGDNFGYANHSVLPSFEIQTRKRGTGVGYKIPSTEVLSRIDPCRLHPRLQPQRRLRSDSYESRAPSPTSTVRKTLPGLLRESGSVTDFNRKKDSARTPTGAGLRHQLQPRVSSVRTPTGAGLRT